jgi:hypothetical protein
LQGIVVVGGILKQAVVRVEHFMRQQEEELSGHSTIVKTLFSLEFNKQPLSEIIWFQLHYLDEGVLKKVFTSHRDLTISLIIIF